MYSIITIVYGIPYDGKINQELADHQGVKPSGTYRNFPEPLYDELEELGWEFLYDGGSDFISGFLGVTLDEFDVTFMPHPDYPQNKTASTENLKLEPTDAQKAEWEALKAKQPDWLTIDDPKVYFIWSTS